QMVQGAPEIAAVLPAFLEFAAGTVLVAHNAPFDLGFLKHSALELEIPWPGNDVVDTATLARKTFTRDEFPNVKLASLAAKFSGVSPDHRALTDAQATVDVLHAIFERLGRMGVSTFEDLVTFSAKVTQQQRMKKHLADAIPNAPGVYLFRDANDQVLYIGTSKNLRTRVRSYFTAAETRSKMTRMIAMATRVDPIVCSTPTEAAVRELRLIAHHRPAFNQRSKNANKLNWLKVTNEPWPRLSIVTSILDDEASYFGPFGSRRAADAARDTLHDSSKIRQCVQRLAVTPNGETCILAQIDKCLSPCDGSVSSADYGAEVSSLLALLSTDAGRLIDAQHHHMSDLAAMERFEEAAMVRDRTHTLLRAISRTQRLRALTAETEIIASERTDSGWNVHVIRYGRLAAAGFLSNGTDPDEWLSQLMSLAETVDSGFGPSPAALVEETEILARWLEGDGVRLIRGSWVWPATMAIRHIERFSWDDHLASLDS
ncbi:MAG: DEDD exonuclease domain-containing protein, partial [Actinomycetales bacterium]|nr:DEDD exonuclease domain-containing protein [Actinomycetales bacterium]